MTREPLVIRNPGYRRHGSNHKKSRPCFFTKSVKFGFGELSIGRICAESRDLGPEHGFRACSFKNKREKSDFHIFGVNKTKKSETLDEIGQLLVSGALDDPKKMRKAGADIFAKSGPEQKQKKCGNNLNVLRDFPCFSRGISQKPVNSRTNGWEPYDL